MHYHVKDVADPSASGPLHTVSRRVADVLLLVPGWREADAREQAGGDAPAWQLADIGPGTGTADGVPLVPTGVQTAEEVLLALVGMPVAGPGALPVAALSLPGAVEPVVCMEPVHLLADRDHGRVLSAAQLGISADEAQSLVASLNDFLQADGCHVSIATPVRWFLHGVSPAGLDTWPAHAVTQRNTAPYMPRGDAAAPWRRLMTEVQMLLHTHPVNEQRAAAGRPTINGAWFWGGSPLPAREPTGRDWLVVADDPFARVLAEHAGLGAVALGELDASGFAASLARATEAGRDLLVVDTACYDAWLSADVEAMLAALRHIVEQRLEPALAARAVGQVGSVFVHDGEGALQELSTAGLPAGRHTAADRGRAMISGLVRRLAALTSRGRA